MTWIDELASELGVASPANEENSALLQSAAEVAHHVERKATPVAMFLLGLAVGSGVSLEDAREKLAALLPNVPHTSVVCSTPPSDEP